MIVPSATQYPQGPFVTEYIFWTQGVGASGIHGNDANVARSIQTAICQLESYGTFHFLGYLYDKTLYFPFYVTSLKPTSCFEILGENGSKEELDNEPAFVIKQNCLSNSRNITAIVERDSRIKTLIDSLEVFKEQATLTIYENDAASIVDIEDPTVEMLVGSLSQAEAAKLFDEFVQISAFQKQTSLLTYLKVLSHVDDNVESLKRIRSLSNFPKKDFTVVETFWAREGYERIALKIQRFICAISPDLFDLYIPFYEFPPTSKPTFQITWKFNDCEDWHLTVVLERSDVVFSAAKTLLSICTAKFTRRFLKVIPIHDTSDYRTI